MSPQNVILAEAGIQKLTTSWDVIIAKSLPPRKRGAGIQKHSPRHTISRNVILAKAGIHLPP